MLWAAAMVAKAPATKMEVKRMLMDFEFVDIRISSVK